MGNASDGVDCVFLHGLRRCPGYQVGTLAVAMAEASLDMDNREAALATVYEVRRRVMLPRLWSYWNGDRDVTDG